MEVNEDKTKGSKSVAFQAEQEVDHFQNIKDSLALLARNFGKALKRVERDQNRDGAR